jgi:hypothetical protein
MNDIIMIIQDEKEPRKGKDGVTPRQTIRIVLTSTELQVGHCTAI